MKLLKRKYVSVLILGGVFICAGLFIVFSSRQTASTTDTERYTVTRGDIRETIVSSGNVTVAGNAAIYSPSTGIVEEIYIKNGDTVTEGQELVKIKSTATESEKAEALAAYQTAQSAVNTTKQTKISNQSLLEAGRKSVIDASVALEQMTNRRNNGLTNPTTGKAYTQDEIDSIQSTYTSAKKSFEALEKKFLDSDTAIAAAQSTATSAWYNYQSALSGTIQAPVEGIISNLSVVEGESVQSGTSVSGVLPILRIITGETMSVTVKLSEIDVIKVHEESSATVIFDAIPDQQFSAVVSRVDTVGNNSNSVVTYTAYVSLQDTDKRIRPAMTATVTINSDEKNNILLVPNAALTQEEAGISVRVLSGSKSKLIPVTVGVKNTTHSEVVSGLQEGDVVLVPKTE